MADSKITQLSLSPYALDKDLVVVVTGHLEEGAFPRNVKMPLSYIRRYVVRLNLLTSPQSGISTYYNSGLNVLTLQHTPLTGNLMRYDYAENLPHDQTISTTGLNAIQGNNIDIVFRNNSAAAIAMDTKDGAWYAGFGRDANLGDPYHSGIISTTGLNATDANLMRVDYEGAWPHTGLISQTGLNIIRGNLIDIQFQKTSDAASAIHSRLGSWPTDFNRNEDLGEPYHSGIVSVTGLNAYSGGPWGNLMRVDIDHNRWPHSGIISQTGLNAIRGNLVDIQFSSTSEAATAMHNRDAGWLRTFNTGNHLGDKYHSGIISITGVNARTENLLVKEYEDTWPYTGVYYNTGLNAKAGNHIEIMHSTNSDANFFYPGIMGEKYQSGVISVTGLNVSQVTGNLIVNHIDPNWPHRNILHTTGLNAYSGAPWGNNVRVDYGSQWPYSGIISQTGLNVIRGNLIDIQFDSTSDAATTMHNTNGAWDNTFNISNHLGNKYHSGIISVTGLNVDGDGGNRITYNISNDWPYKYSIDATGLNIVAGNTFSNALNGIGYNIEPNNHHRYDLFSLNKTKYTSLYQSFTLSGNRTTAHYMDSKAIVSYCNAKNMRPNDSLTVLAELGIRLDDDCINIWLPTVPGFGSTNAQKTSELSSAAGNPEDWEPFAAYIDNGNYPLEVQITISGNSYTSMDKYPITFTTNRSAYHTYATEPGKVAGTEATPFGTFYHVYEKHRSSSMSGLSGGLNYFNMDNPTIGEVLNSRDSTNNPYTLGGNRAMTLNGIVFPDMNSSTYNPNGCVAIQYSLTNPKFSRTYRKADNSTFVSTHFPAAIELRVSPLRYLKCEVMEQSPTITFMTQPVDTLSTDGTATLTGEAKLNDYTDPLYQWEKAESGTLTFAPVAGQNSDTLNLTGLNFLDDNGDKYRLSITAYDGVTTSTSSIATLTVQPPIITITSDPDPQPIAHDGTASFSASASANIPGSIINYQWQVSTDGGVSYSDITDATSNTLNLTELTSSDDGNLYRMKANASGFNEVISAAAELYYIEITISSHPSDLTVARGTGLLSVSATQTADSPFNLYYRWERSTDSGNNYSYYNAGTGLANLIFTDSSNITYANHDQDQFRVKVRLQGFGDDVETTGNAAILTVQEINVLTQPDSTNTITGKDLLTPTNTQTLIPTTGGDVNLFVEATGRNSATTLNYQWQTGNIPTYYWQSPTVWGDIAGETNKLLEVRGLLQNSTYQFYRCVIDDDLNGLDDTTGMENKISNTCKVTTSTFVGDSSVSIDDNATFATVERDGTSSLSETAFLTFCYDLDQGVGYTASVDAQANEQAGINFGTGLAPLGPTGIARLLATHPDSASDTASIGSGPQFSAGDVINIQATGNVNQFLGRVNVPTPTTLSIISQPQDFTVTEGTGFFRVSTFRSGPGNLRFTWQRAEYNGSSYGAWTDVTNTFTTTATISVYEADFTLSDDRDYYRCKIGVTNTDIELFSNSGLLTVQDILIHKQPIETDIVASVLVTGVDIFTHDYYYPKLSQQAQKMIPSVQGGTQVSIEATGVNMNQGDLNFQWQTGIVVGNNIQFANYGSSSSSNNTIVNTKSINLFGARLRMYLRCVIDDGGSHTATSDNVLISDTPWISEISQVDTNGFNTDSLFHRNVQDKGGYWEIFASGDSSVTRAHYDVIRFYQDMPVGSGIGYEAVIKRDGSPGNTTSIGLDVYGHSTIIASLGALSSPNGVDSASANVNAGARFFAGTDIHISVGDFTSIGNTANDDIEGHSIKILVPKY